MGQVDDVAVGTGADEKRFVDSEKIADRYGSAVLEPGKARLSSSFT